MRRVMRTLMLPSALVVIWLARPGQAQTTDSVTIGVDSRYVWRQYDRGGAELHSTLGVGLLWCSTTHSSKELNDLRQTLQRGRHLLIAKHAKPSISTWQVCGTAGVSRPATSTNGASGGSPLSPRTNMHCRTPSVNDSQRKASSQFADIGM